MITRLLVTLVVFASSACGIAQAQKQAVTDLTHTKPENPSISSIFPSADSLVKLTDSIAWNETTHVFEGGVPTGPPATFQFKFTNYSNHAIKVGKVDAACSCTATDFSRESIAPGQSGWIEAAYKTSNTFGYFKKYVDVYFEHSNNQHRLYLTGSVDPYKTK